MVLEIRDGLGAFLKSKDVASTRSRNSEHSSFGRASLPLGRGLSSSSSWVTGKYPRVLLGVREWFETVEIGRYRAKTIVSNLPPVRTNETPNPDFLHIAHQFLL